MKLRAGTPKDAGMLASGVEHVRDLCAGWVKEGHTPSLSVCVARRGVVVLHEAWGKLGPEDDAAPLETSSLFPIMSCTKPITATLVMQLIEDGVLGLNRPVLDYLPEIASEGAEDILVHHLLTHTSGYMWDGDPPVREHVVKKRAQGLDPGPCPENQHPWVHDHLALFWDAPRSHRAGEIMVYSNHNYLLLGEIVRRLTGQLLDALCRQRVFEPLGMLDSHQVIPDSELARVVRRPPGAPGTENVPVPAFPGIVSSEALQTPNAGGGVISTPLDMAIFGQAFLNRGRYGDARILSPPSVAAMTRDQIPGLRAHLMSFDVAHASWGYGWAVESPTKWRYFNGSLGPLGTLSHPGAFGAMFWVDPANEIVGAYFEVCTTVTRDYEFLWNFDLFTNAVTAAVDG